MKKYLMFIFILSLLFISGCQRAKTGGAYYYPSPTGSPTEEEESPTEEYTEPTESATEEPSQQPQPPQPEPTPSASASQECCNYFTKRCKDDNLIIEEGICEEAGASPSPSGSSSSDPSAGSSTYKCEKCRCIVKITEQDCTKLTQYGCSRDGKIVKKEGYCSDSEKKCLNKEIAEIVDPCDDDKPCIEDVCVQDPTKNPTDPTSVGCKKKNKPDGTECDPPGDATDGFCREGICLEKTCENVYGDEDDFKPCGHKDAPGLRCCYKDWLCCGKGTKQAMCCDPTISGCGGAFGYFYCWGKDCEERGEITCKASAFPEIWICCPSDKICGIQHEGEREIPFCGDPSCNKEGYDPNPCYVDKREGKEGNIEIIYYCCKTSQECVDVIGKDGEKTQKKICSAETCGEKEFKCTGKGTNSYMTSCCKEGEICLYHPSGYPKCSICENGRCTSSITDPGAIVATAIGPITITGVQQVIYDEAIEGDGVDALELVDCVVYYMWERGYKSAPQTRSIFYQNLENVAKEHGFTINDLVFCIDAYKAS